MTQLRSRHLAISFSIKDSQAIHKTFICTFTGLPLTKGVEDWQEFLE